MYRFVAGWGHYQGQSQYPHSNLLSDMDIYIYIIKKLK